jgi:hypothetical protein
MEVLWWGNTGSRYLVYTRLRCVNGAGLSAASAVSVCSQSHVLCLQARLKIDHLGQRLLIRISSPDYNVLHACVAANFIANKRGPHGSSRCL